LSGTVTDFQFYVNGIEDAVVAALQAKVGEYAGDISLYSGELDEAPKLRDALAALANRFPLFLVTYTEGKSTRETQIAPGQGAPWSVRHDCTFLVIVADDDARGEDKRRRGAYNMASEVLAALESRQFVYVTEENEKIVLTPGEFISSGIEHIASYPDVTAYAVPFQTYFKYLTPDRRPQAQAIDSIVFEFNPLNQHRDAPGAPGVTVSN
jgi:phage gp37-like protein